jgi:hypothetical protein
MLEALILFFCNAETLYQMYYLPLRIADVLDKVPNYASIISRQLSLSSTEFALSGCQSEVTFLHRNGDCHFAGGRLHEPDRRTSQKESQKRWIEQRPIGIRWKG